MNKIFTLLNSTKKSKQPKQKTIDFLLNFSKSIEVVKVLDSKYLLVKN